MTRLLHLCKVGIFKCLSAALLMILTMAFFPPLVNADTSVQVGADPQAWGVKRDAAEIAGKRTQNSKTFDNHDGSYTLVIGQNYHYQTSEGKWEEIDTKLENASGKKMSGQAYDLSVTKAPFHAYFGKNSNAPQLFEVPGKGQIIIQPIDSKSSSGTVTENKIMYPAVWKEVDWVRTVLPEGVKSDIILHNTTAQNEFRFKVQAPNLEYEQQSDGTVLWKQGKEVVAMFRAATVMDAAGKEGVAYQRIESTVAGLELVIGVDPDWLAAPDRAWPVTIDPTVTIQPSTQTGIDTTVNSGLPTSSYARQFYMSYGKDSRGNWRALLKFDISSIPASKAIISAKIQVTCYYGTSTIAMLHKVTSRWIETVTWDTQPTYDATPILTLDTPSPEAKQLWDITALFTSWYNGTVPNYGVVWERDNWRWSSWYTSDYSKSSDRPALIVVYTTAPLVTPTSPLGTAAVPSYISTLTPSITWSYSDTDADAQASYQVIIKRSSDDVTVKDSGEVAGAATSYIVPASTITVNTKYYYQVRVKDSKGAWSSYTPSQYFLALASPSNFSLIPGQTTVNATWSSNGNPADTVYQLWRGNQVVYQGTGLSYSDTELTPNTTYQYSVNALGSDGGATDSVSGSVTTYSSTTIIIDYNYDSQNRLNSIQLPTGEVITNFQYDANGNLIKRQVLGQ